MSADDPRSGALPDAIEGSTEVLGIEGRKALVETDLGVLGERADPPAAPRESAPYRAGELVGAYRLLELLATTETGVVYLAERADGIYEKRVAVKVLASDLPREALRRERDALAALEHSSIARLVGTGDLAEGPPFLVTEHVDGPPLDRYCDGQCLPIDQRLALFSKVCSAVHVAHQNLVVHGDLRPESVLVTADGDPKIMFFGASPPSEEARVSPDSPCASASPSSAAERRCAPTTASDVQALGSLLVALLVGRPLERIGGTVTKPSTIAGEAAEVIAAARRETPTSLRRRLRGDLDAIALAATASEPGRGYLSALALGQDIDRYLSGYPVLARRAGTPYLVAKWIERRRLLVAVTAGSILAVLAVGLYLAARGQEDRRRSQLAQHFGQQGAEIAELTRLATLLPRHPTGYVRDEIRRRMARIEDEVSRLGELAEGPASYALGRGHLALHDYERARENLEHAWRSGFQSPETALSLGTALGELYGRALDESERLDEQIQRSSARRRAATLYRDPALAYLRASHLSNQENSAYLEGLIAFYDERLDDALASARYAFAEAPWLYEARELEAAVLVEQGFAEQRRGRYAEARRLYDAAGDAYRGALELARSDATAYAGECGRRSRVVRLEHEMGTLDEELVAHALEPCEHALEIDPDRTDAYTHAARIRLRWADRQVRRGEDPRAGLTVAQQLVTAILEREAGSPVALRLRGDALYILAKWQGEHAEGSEEALDRAIAAFTVAASARPADAELLNARGNALLAKARLLGAHRAAPWAAFEAAASSYRRAIALDPNYAAAHGNLGSVYLERARSEMAQGMVAEPSIRTAIPSLDRAVELNPFAASAHQNLGAAYLALGQDRLLWRQDPAEPLGRAVGLFRRATELDAGYFIAYHNLAVAAQIEAAHRLQGGLDPSDPVQRSLIALEEARRVRPSAGALNEGAKAFSLMLLARWAIARGADPRPFFDAAATTTDRALSLDPNLTNALSTRAELLWHRAAWSGAGTPDGRRLLGAGLTAARRCLEIQPRESRALAVEGALLLLAAHEATGEQRRKLAARAVRQLETASSSNTLWDRDSFDLVLDEARHVAAGKAMPAVDRQRAQTPR